MCVCLYERVETESPRVGLPITIGSLIGVAFHKAFSVYVTSSQRVCVCVLVLK